MFNLKNFNVTLFANYLSINAKIFNSRIRNIILNCNLKNLIMLIRLLKICLSNFV